jgi:epoxyqueuosine reductase QueG
MRCQEVCPLNTKYLGMTYEPDIAFSKEETAAILGNTPLHSLPEGTQTKLHELCLDEDYTLLSRNIGILLASTNQR